MFKSSNVGKTDRIIRMIAGIILIAAPFVSPGMLGGGALAHFGLPAVGAILIVTALMRFCPFYHLIGARTCKVE